MSLKMAVRNAIEEVQQSVFPLSVENVREGFPRFLTETYQTWLKKVRNLEPHNSGDFPAGGGEYLLQPSEEGIARAILDFALPISLLIGDGSGLYHRQPCIQAQIEAELEQLLKTPLTREEFHQVLGEEIARLKTDRAKLLTQTTDFWIDGPTKNWGFPRLRRLRTGGYDLGGSPLLVYQDLAQIEAGIHLSEELLKTTPLKVAAGTLAEFQTKRDKLLAQLNHVDELVRALSPPETFIVKPSGQLSGNRRWSILLHGDNSIPGGPWSWRRYTAANDWDRPVFPTGKIVRTREGCLAFFLLHGADWQFGNVKPIERSATTQAVVIGDDHDDGGDNE